MKFICYTLFLIITGIIGIFYFKPELIQLSISNFESILKYLENKKEGIQILLDILKFIAVILVSLAGIILSYFGLAREIKFSRIKEIIKNQGEIKLEVQKLCISLQTQIESKILEESSGKVISINKIKQIRKLFIPLFELSHRCVSEIANQIVILQSLFDNSIAILENTGHSNSTEDLELRELIEEKEFLIYTSYYIDSLLSISSKVEKSLSAWDIFFPNKKIKEFYKKFYIFTRSKRPEKVRFYNIGINFRYLQAEILALVNYTLRYRTYLIPYAIFGSDRYSKYIARSLFLDYYYMPVIFEINKLSIYGEKTRFKLFKIKKSNSLGQKRKIVEFIYVKQTPFEKISSKGFFSSLESKKGYTYLQDKYYSSKIKIKDESISVSTMYGHINIVTIRINDVSVLRKIFLKNIHKIALDLLSKTF